MTFLIIEGEIIEGEIKIEVRQHLSNLQGLDPETIGRCAVVANHVAGAVGMVLQQDGALLTPTINATGEDSERSN